MNALKLLTLSALFLSVSNVAFSTPGTDNDLSVLYIAVVPNLGIRMMVDPPVDPENVYFEIDQARIGPGFDPFFEDPVPVLLKRREASDGGAHMDHDPQHSILVRFDDLQKMGFPYPSFIRIMNGPAEPQVVPVMKTFY